MSLFYIPITSLNIFLHIAYPTKINNFLLAVLSYRIKFPPTLSLTIVRTSYKLATNGLGFKKYVRSCSVFGMTPIGTIRESKFKPFSLKAEWCPLILTFHEKFILCLITDESQLFSFVPRILGLKLSRISVWEMSSLHLHRVFLPKILSLNTNHFVLTGPFLSTEKPKRGSSWLKRNERFTEHLINVRFFTYIASSAKYFAW